MMKIMRVQVLGFEGLDMSTAGVGSQETRALMPPLQQPPSHVLAETKEQKSAF